MSTPDDIEVTAEKPRRPRWVRVLIGIGVTVAVLLVIGVVGAWALLNYGGPSGSIYPDMEGRYDALVAAGQASPLEDRFVIPIPGCKCHSTDPVLTAEHARRRMNECSNCHSRGAPM